jgi:hypothetical protein
MDAAGLVSGFGVAWLLAVPVGGSGFGSASRGFRSCGEMRAVCGPFDPDHTPQIVYACFFYFLFLETQAHKATKSNSPHQSFKHEV